MSAVAYERGPEADIEQTRVPDDGIQQPPQSISLLVETSNNKRGDDQSGNDGDGEADPIQDNIANQRRGRGLRNGRFSSRGCRSDVLDGHAGNTSVSVTISTINWPP